jgi:hypothetical protein
MKLKQCTKCGGSELLQIENHLLCTFCRSKFALEPDEIGKLKSNIGLKGDIDELLRKCESDPTNRGRYIQLILDIDPRNSAVQKYLESPKKKKWWEA